MIKIVNINLLKSETVKRGYKDSDVATKALHISTQAYNKKLRLKTKFSTNDAIAICNFLGIKDSSLRADIFLV